MSQESNASSSESSHFSSDAMKDIPENLQENISPSAESSHIPSGMVKETHEDLRAGYLAALQLAVYDGQLSWQITGTFLQFAILMIVAAIFPSFAGSNNNFISALAALGVSIAGVIMTSMFGSMVTRIRTYEEYWILRATHLESYLNNSVEILKGSSFLSAQGHITVGGNTVYMPRMAAIRSKTMLAAFFILFLIAFLSLLAFNIWRIIFTI